MSKSQDLKLRTLGNTLSTIWNNQQELAKSADRLDEQFCVLGRLMFNKFNDLSIGTGSEDLIGESEIEKGFREWDKFRDRPDFKNYMMEWFLGLDLEELPPVDSVVPTKNEDNREFGGDYVNEDSSVGEETASEGQQSVESSDQSNQMPKGQDIDSSLRDQEQNSSEVPQVSNSV